MSSNRRSARFLISSAIPLLSPNAAHPGPLDSGSSAVPQPGHTGTRAQCTSRPTGHGAQYPSQNPNPPPATKLEPESRRSAPSPLLSPNAAHPGPLDSGSSAVPQPGHTGTRAQCTSRPTGHGAQYPSQNPNPPPATKLEPESRRSAPSPLLSPNAAHPGPLDSGSSAVPQPGHTGTRAQCTSRPTGHGAQYPSQNPNPPPATKLEPESRRSAPSRWVDTWA